MRPGVRVRWRLAWRTDPGTLWGGWVLGGFIVVVAEATVVDGGTFNSPVDTVCWSVWGAGVVLTPIARALWRHPPLRRHFEESPDIRSAYRLD